MAIPAKLIVQGLLVGGAIGLVTKALRKRRARKTASSVDCSDLKNSGGTLNGIRYLETIRGGSDPTVRMPMVVVFHSRGATPGGAASFPGLGGPVRIIRPAGFHQTQLGGYNWFTHSSKKDPEGLTREMRQRGAELAGFLGALMQCRPTLGRPIVTGSSAGGHVAYLLASQYPELVGGSVALLGYIPPGLWNPSMAPTVGLHSTGDNTVPFARTKAYWDAMLQGGARLETKTFPGGHSIVPGMGAAWRAGVKKFANEQRGLVT